LYSATTHACLNRIRNAKTRLHLLQSQFPRPIQEPAREPDHAVLQLHQVLARMPDELARVAVYAFVDELSYDEIAELLGCSRRHVANLLQRVDAWARMQEEPSCC
jgi:RNA polymerase sigma-70 factor (ECF subfamily)